MIEREPIRDTNAERATLGGMLLSKDAIAEVSELLRPSDFYEPRHEQIYTAILDLYADGQPADPITTASLLEARGELTKAGGPVYLHDLTACVPNAASAGHYAEIVLAKAKRRHLARVGDRFVQMAYETSDDDIAQIIDQAQAEAYTLTRDSREDESTLADSFDRVLEKFENGAVRGMPTGFTDLDQMTNGLKPGKLTVIAARPALGKSTLGVDIVRHVSIRNRRHSMIFALEMDQDEITQRIIAAEARVSLYRMEHGMLTDADWKAMAEHRPAITTAPIHIDDSPSLTMMSIRTKARRAHQRHGLALIVVDYIQLMTAGTGKKNANRQEEVAAMSRGLKLLAKELGIPIIAIAQLNRGPETREDKKPRMSDLRESGSLEQDADVVILIHREDAYEKESPRAGEADLLVEKNRSGPKGEVTVSFEGHYARFQNMGGN